MTFLSMIFLHIIDDFFIQPLSWLSNGKQMNWWKEHAPDHKYRYDYLWALFMHSFSWSFMIMLPIAWNMNWSPEAIFYCLFVCNVIIHGFVDHIKANWLKINLIQDQLIHMSQIIVTYFVLRG